MPKAWTETRVKPALVLGRLEIQPAPPLRETSAGRKNPASSAVALIAVQIRNPGRSDPVASLAAPTRIGAANIAMPDVVIINP